MSNKTKVLIVTSNLALPFYAFCAVSRLSLSRSHRLVNLSFKRGKWKAFLTEVLETGMQRNEFKGKFLPEVAADAIISVIRGLTITCAGRPELMRRPLYQILSWVEGARE